MDPVVYEIVMLANGEVVLQRADEVEAPLLKISFSEEAKEMLGSEQLSVAKEMIDAGIDAVAQINPSGSSILEAQRVDKRQVH